MILLIELLKKNYIKFFLIIWCFFLFNPIIFSGLLSDDGYNFQVGGKLIDEKINIFTLYINETYGWLRNSGRFFPLHWFVYFLNYYINDILLLKIIIYLLNLTVLFLIFKLFSKYLKKEKTALLAIILLPSIYFFRNEYDPIITWNGRIQLIYIFFILSLIYLLKFIKTEKKSNLYISYTYHFVSILFYEISYLNFIILILFSLILLKGKGIKYIFNLVKFYFIPPIILVLLGFWLRSKYSFWLIFDEEIKPSYPGVILDLNNYFNFFFLQIKITFTGIIKLVNINILNNLNIRDKFFFTISFFFLVKIFLNIYHDKINKNTICAVIFGFCLLVLPAAIISSSQKYKQEFLENSELIYANIYPQYIGMTIIICVLLSLIYFKNIFLKYIFSIFLSLLVINCAIFTYGQNIKFNEDKNLKFKQVPYLIDSAINRGIFNGLNENTIILQNSNLPWDWYWFTARKTKKIFKFCEIKNLFNENQCLNTKYYLDIKELNKETFDIDVKNYEIFAFYYYFTGDNGYVNLFKISKVQKNGDLKIFSHEVLEFNIQENKLVKKKLENEVNVSDFFTTSKLVNNHLLKKNKINLN
jgi:hypothetical protein